MARDRSSAPRQVTPSHFRHLTMAALVAQVVIVLTGAAVRLTGSGLGCSDWPNCEQDRLVAPLELNPMIEFVNRMVSFVVVATVIAVIWGAVRRVPYRRDLVRLGWWLAALTGAQVVIGGITVRTDLWPPIVMVHFLLSMALIAIAVVLHHRAQVAVEDPSQPLAANLGQTQRWIVPLVLAAVAVLVTGTIVTGSGPHGGDEEVERLGFYVPTVTRVHTTAVFILLALLVVVLLGVRRSGNRRVLGAGTVVLASTLVQGAIGYYQYFNGVPALAVFLHVAGAMVVWAAVVWFALEHRHVQHHHLEPARSAPSDAESPAQVAT